MPTPAHAYLVSFARRANIRLLALTRQLAAALATGDEAGAATLVHEGQLLRHGLRSCAETAGGMLAGQLTEPQRVYIVGKLLPLLGDYAEPAPVAGVPVLSASLTFNALAGRLRGQLSSGPLALSGQLSGPLPAGSQLLISRDGYELFRQAAVVGAWRFTDLMPGAGYRVELTGTQLNRERQRPLLSPVLFGNRPHGATPAQLLSLAASADSLLDGSGRFAFVGARDRMYLAVPLSQGDVTRYTQPNDQNADITSGFTHSLLTLDFGADGTDQYRVSESTVDFIGPLTLDAHLV